MWRRVFAFHLETHLDTWTTATGTMFLRGSKKRRSNRSVSVFFSFFFPSTDSLTSCEFHQKQPEGSSSVHESKWTGAPERNFHLAVSLTSSLSKCPTSCPTPKIRLNQRVTFFVSWVISVAPGESGGGGSLRHRFIPVIKLLLFVLKKYTGFMFNAVVFPVIAVAWLTPVNYLSGSKHQTDTSSLRQITSGRLLY